MKGAPNFPMIKWAFLGSIKLSVAGNVQEKDWISVSQTVGHNWLKSYEINLWVMTSTFKKLESTGMK